MVVEALAGQQDAKYLKQHDAAAQAIGSLRRVAPWQMGPVLEWTGEANLQPGPSARRVTLLP